MLCNANPRDKKKKRKKKEKKKMKKKIPIHLYKPLGVDAYKH